jgi:Gram-negative bacterial TonB protein C-terminal
VLRRVPGRGFVGLDPILRRTGSREAETYHWKPDGTLVYLLGEDAIVLTPTADRQEVDVQLRAPQPRQIAPDITEHTVMLELLVGTHGFVKEARVLQSSGLPDVDDRAIAQAENSMKLEPFMENGRRVEKRGRFPVKVRVKQ